MGTPQHWHVWRIAATGRAAFMGRPYLKRDTAKKAAERWAGRHRRELTFVHECVQADCPRPPRLRPPDAGAALVMSARRPAVIGTPP